MGNVVTFQIDNCKDCKNHYVERIYTADSFEHESGLYCSCVKDDKSYNKKHKLVASDDIDVTKYSQIPNWCPLLNKDESKLE